MNRALRATRPAGRQLSAHTLGGGASIMECAFCEIVQGNAPVSEVHRDDLVLAFMDIQPINPGHVLVVPIQHSTYLGELDPEVAAHLFRMAQCVAAAIRRSGVQAEGVNLLLADGEAAGQEVLHQHLHVVPRFTGDSFGFRFGPNHTDRPERKMLDAVAARIVSTLDSVT